MLAASTHGMHGYRAVGHDKRLPSASRGWRRAVDAETYNRGRATPFDRRGGDLGVAAVLDQANPDGRAGCVGSGAPPRHERREAGRERHQETGEPAWEESDRLDDPPGTGKRNPDAAPEILGGV